MDDESSTCPEIGNLGTIQALALSIHSAGVAPSRPPIELEPDADRAAGPGDSCPAVALQ